MEYCMVSSGVSSADKRPGAKHTPITVMTAPTQTASSAAVCTARLTFSRSCAP